MRLYYGRHFSSFMNSFDCMYTFIVIGTTLAGQGVEEHFWQLLISRSMGYRIISYSDNAYVSHDRCEFWQIDVRLSFQGCRCKGNGDIFSHFKVRICSPVSWYKSQSRASIWFQLRKDTRMQSWLRGMQLIWKIYSVATSEATSEGRQYDGFIFDLGISVKIVLPSTHSWNRYGYFCTDYTTSTKMNREEFTNNLIIDL